MANLFDKMEDFLGLYHPFVHSLRGTTLLSLAVATISTGLFSLSQTGIPTVVDNLSLILASSLLYLFSVSLYIRFRRSDNQQIPATPIQFPFFESFLDAGYFVGSLAFFLTCLDPVRSVPDPLHGHVICVSVYLHVLIVLAILRWREDPGVSKGCFFAAAHVMCKLAKKTKSEWIVVFIVMSFLSTIGEMQFHTRRRRHENHQIPDLIDD